MMKMASTSLYSARAGPSSRNTVCRLPPPGPPLGAPADPADGNVASLSELKITPVAGEAGTTSSTAPGWSYALRWLPELVV